MSNEAWAKVRRENPLPLKQVAPDRWVLTDDDREMCRACGEFPIREGGMYCRKCNAQLDEEREQR